jgi:protein translocase SecG subunit
MRTLFFFDCPFANTTIRIAYDCVLPVPSRGLRDVDFIVNLLSVLIFTASLVMILLILIQRGRGGGLIGALGGSGGSSPFGSRAGDTFTRITLVTAAVWMFLIMLQILLREG